MEMPLGCHNYLVVVSGAGVEEAEEDETTTSGELLQYIRLILPIIISHLFSLIIHPMGIKVERINC